MLYDGKFEVVEQSRTGGRRPVHGKIIIHKTPKGRPSGQIILRCPFCGGFQNVVAQVEGENDTPTVTTPITCGCRVRCGKVFRIRSGEVHHSEPEEKPPSPKLSKSLSGAGVFYPSEK